MRLGKHGEHKVIIGSLGLSQALRWHHTRSHSLVLVAAAMSYILRCALRWRLRERLYQSVIEDAVKESHGVQVAILFPDYRRVRLAEHFRLSHKRRHKQIRDSRVMNECDAAFANDSLTHCSTLTRSCLVMLLYRESISSM